ncbi:unnamed protein product, partial [Ectocarpus sp. 12 AP-2014]
LLRIAAPLPSPKNAVYVDGKESSSCVLLLLSSAEAAAVEFSKSLAKKNQQAVGNLISSRALQRCLLQPVLLSYPWRTLPPWSNFAPRTPCIVYASLQSPYTSVEIGADN